MRHIITVSVQKGGTGKTTTAAVLAQAAAYRGKRVLAIDLDAQANLSFALATKPDSRRNAFSLLAGRLPAEECVIPSGTGYDLPGQSIDVIPAALELSTITSGPGSALRLQKALAPIEKKYDLIVIDTPSNGEITYNALQASTGLLIPLQQNSYCIQSLYQTVSTARQIQKSNPRLQITGCILTAYNGRSTIARQMEELLTERAQAVGVPYLGRVRTSAAITEAATFQQSLYQYAPRCTAAQDYLQIYDIITKRRRA